MISFFFFFYVVHEFSALFKCTCCFRLIEIILPPKTIYIFIYTLENKNCIDMKIDYNCVDRQFAEWQGKSFDYLENALQECQNKLEGKK